MTAYLDVINLKCVRLSCRIHEALLLNQISFNVSKGQLIALVGPNGAGKSTLLKSLLGLATTATADSCEWFGQELKLWNRRLLARRVAYLPQRLSVPHFGTVSELLQAAYYPHGTLRISKPVDLSIIVQALHSVACTNLINCKLTELSGGDLQRVYLAAALITNPEVLLLDEPSTFLDPKHQALMLDLFKKLVAQGKSIIAVFHDLTTVARKADRILALKAGTLAFDGQVEKFFSAVATDIFEHPVSLIKDTLGGVVVI